jgi:SWI/SNF-related matrix-associated actin-dependent regulator 1 of chromatin subfamily A
MTSDIRCPTPLSYFPYQVEGINFALERNGTLLADEMGVGKTIQAIGVINALGLVLKRILIVCPATMRLVWHSELERWLIYPFSIGVLGVDDVPAQVFSRVNILIINYDRLWKNRELVLSRVWDLVILVESHLVKNPEAYRSRVVAQIHADRRLALSGTPMPNRPLELFSILNWLDPARWPGQDRFKFALRYCAARNTAFGWDLSGASNLEELGTLLRETVMIRRTKAEVLPSLPPKFRRVVELQTGTDLKAVVDYELTLFEKFVKKEMEGTRFGLTKQTGSVDWDNLAKARHTVALAKIPLVVEFVRETVQATREKLVIFAHHRDVIESLATHLAFLGSVILYGGMSSKEKQTSIDRFQTDPFVRVFIGSIQAAGVGITLAPAASHCVFAELSWVPSDLTQAEDRLHRVGTKNNVLVQHLVLRGSLDAIMVRRLIKKQEVLDGVLESGICDLKTTIGTNTEAVPGPSRLSAK